MTPAEIGQIHARMQDITKAGRLSMWTVYDHPTDFPNCYVARLFDVSGKGIDPTSTVVISDDLEKIRHVMEVDLQLACLRRQAGDDAKIVETWV